MTVKVELATDADANTFEDITDEVYLQGARWSGTASRGEIDTGSGFNWRDDAGTRVIPWRRRIKVTETAVSPTYILWQGRTIGDEMMRGPILTEDAKMFDVNLVDTNADFAGFPFAGTQRPAEDDDDRIRYLIDNYLSGQYRGSTVIGETYFPETSNYALTAHLYEGVQLIDWFTHITDTTGREFFLTKDYDLFYDIPASTAYAAGIDITDVSPNFTTSFPPVNPQATEDSTELFTGVRFRWAGGTVTVVRSAIETANDTWRTVIVDESVTTAAAATTRANVFLDEFDHTRTTFRCAVELPAGMVDALSWGMTVSFRSAACGVLSPLTYRITRLSWELIGEGLWRADMELNYASKFGRKSKPGTPVVVGPVPFTPSASIFQTAWNQEQVVSSITVTWPNPVGVGDLLIGCYAIRSHNVTGGPSGWTGHPSGLVSVSGGSSTGEMFYDLAASGSETTETFTGSGGDRQIATILEVPGTWTLVDSAETTGTGASFGTGSVTPTAGKRALIIGMYIQHATDSPQTVTPDAGWTELQDRDAEVGGFEPHQWVGYKIVSSASGSYNPSGTSSNSGGAWGGQTLAFVTDDEPATPAQGQPVTETATGNGVTTVFTTSHPYATGSLRVLVNGVDVTSSVTETSPSAGTFTFSSAPNSGATITIRYLGAAA